MSTDFEPQDRLLRLKHVLKIIPMSRSAWWAGVRAGRLPEPVRLGNRCTCWRESDIYGLLGQGF